MAYISFQDDPISERFNASYASLCEGDPSKKVLKLLDRCFTIYNRAKSEVKFCDFSNLLYPVDSSVAIDFEVCAGETLSIYNNDLEGILPSTSGNAINYPLTSGEYVPVAGTTTGTSGTAGTAGTSGTETIPYYYLLANDRSYARACLLYIYYPSTDKLGNDVNPGNMNCTISTADRLGNTASSTMGQVYSYFGNPVTGNANNLINRIEITNPNQNFSIKVKGLVIYVKSNVDPNDCAC